MKVVKKLASFGLVAALLATPFTSSLAVGDSNLLSQDLGPEFFSAQGFEIYPHVPDAGGFTSVVVVTNLLSTPGFFSIFSVPFGTTEFIARENIRFEPRQTRFFRPQDLALSNNTGQVWVTAADQSSFGASLLFLFGPAGDFTTVNPSIIPR